MNFKKNKIFVFLNKEQKINSMLLIFLVLIEAKYLDIIFSEK